MDSPVHFVFTFENHYIIWYYKDRPKWEVSIARFNSLSLASQ